jgi:hypothetical protein
MLTVCETSDQGSESDASESSSNGSPAGSRAAQPVDGVIGFREHVSVGLVAFQAVFEMDVDGGEHAADQLDAGLAWHLPVST